MTLDLLELNEPKKKKKTEDEINIAAYLPVSADHQPQTNRLNDTANVKK